VSLPAHTASGVGDDAAVYPEESSTWRKLEVRHRRHTLQARKSLCSTGALDYLISPMVHRTSAGDKSPLTAGSSTLERDGTRADASPEMILEHLREIGGQELLAQAVTYPDAMPETRSDAAEVLQRLASLRRHRFNW
jgi:hypothetical protein